MNFKQQELKCIFSSKELLLYHSNKLEAAEPEYPYCIKLHSVRRNKMKLRKTLSVLLILIGFLIAIWGKFTLLAGLPLFITGAILNFFTNRVLWLKLLLVILPVLLWRPAVLWVWYTKNRAVAEQDTYIFPKGFYGKAVIAYGIEKGDSVQVVNGRRTFRFDTSGIIITQAAPAGGIIDQHFYYEDSQGTLTRLKPYPYFQQKSEEDSASIRVFGWHEPGFRPAGEGCEYKFMQLSVCKLTNFDSFYYSSKKLMEQMEQRICDQ